MTATLVLLPGLDGTDVFFRPLLGQLPDRVRPLVLGYPDDGPHGYGALLERVRRDLADIRECHVLASSFSGPLAVMLAAAEPQKVRGIILAASFLRAPRRYPAALRLIATAPMVGALRTARRLPIWLLRRKEDALRQAKRETWSRVSARGLAGRARAVLGADARAMLQTCTQPVLCIAYAGDRVVARGYVEEILLHNPSAKLVTLPGGHLGMFDDPAALASEVVRFVDRQ